MSTAKRVIKNTGILYARMAITIFITLYSTRLILKALGVEDFGIFNLVAGTVAMLTFLNAAMSAATQRFMSFSRGANDMDKLKNIFVVSVVLHLIIAFVVLLLFEGAGYFLFNDVLTIDESRIPAAKIVYQLVIVSTLFTIISVPYDAVINANENMLLFAIISIIEALGRLGIAIYVTYTDYDKLISYAVLTTLLSIVLLSANRLYVHKRYAECSFNFKKYFDRGLFSEMATFGGWSLLGSMTGMLSNYGQGIVINIFFGTVVNAAQGVSTQISGQIQTFSLVMLKALNPIIVKTEGSGNRELMIKTAMTGSKFSFFLMSFFAVPVIIDMPNILHLWLANVPDYAIIFCQLLLLKNLIEQLVVTLSVSITATGNIRDYQISLSLLAVFPLVISYFLYKNGFEPYVMYIVFLIQSFIRSFGIILYFAKIRCNLSIPVFFKNVVLRAIVVSGLVAIVDVLFVNFTSPGLFRFLIMFAISSLLFVILINYVGLIKEERKLVSLSLATMVGKLKGMLPISR